MRNKSKKMLIMTLVTTLILGGLSPMFVAAEMDPEKILSIAWVYPSSVLEGVVIFEVKVVKKNTDEGVPEATVMVETMGSEETKEDGVATFIKWKTVNHDTYFNISAGKPGWTFDGNEKTIEIRNKVLHFDPDPPDYVFEQTPVTVTVLNQDDNPFLGALVTFGDDWDITDWDGEATVDAPDVTGIQLVEISASFGIYEPAIDYIYVIDTDDEETYINCYVYNSSGPGEMIEGATVTIVQGGEGSNTTNEFGYCELIVYPDELYGTDYVLKAEADGYDPEYWSKHMEAGEEYTHYFGLSPKGTGGVVVEVTEINELMVEFQATISQSDTISVTYLWDYGDDTSDETDEGISSHDYSGAGYYKVEVIATIITPWGQVQDNGKIGLFLEH